MNYEQKLGFIAREKKKDEARDEKNAFLEFTEIVGLIFEVTLSLTKSCGRSHCWPLTAGRRRSFKNSPPFGFLNCRFLPNPFFRDGGKISS